MPVYKNGGASLYIQNWSFTGGHIAALNEISEQLGAFIERPRVKGFYIGKTSGYEYSRALCRRDDAYKQEQGFNLIAAYYRSSSAKNVTTIERALSDHFNDHPKNRNRNKGSQGRLSSAAEHYIYVAFRLWPNAKRYRIRGVISRDPLSKRGWQRFVVVR